MFPFCCCDCCDDVVVTPTCSVTLYVHDVSFWNDNFTAFDGSSNHICTGGKYRIVGTKKCAYLGEVYHCEIYVNGSPLDPFFLEASSFGEWLESDFYSGYPDCPNLNFVDDRSF